MFDKDFQVIANKTKYTYGNTVIENSTHKLKVTNRNIISYPRFEKSLTFVLDPQTCT
jgi:hypothetical protein